MVQCEGTKMGFWSLSKYMTQGYVKNLGKVLKKKKIKINKKNLDKSKNKKYKNNTCLLKFMGWCRENSSVFVCLF